METNALKEILMSHGNVFKAMTQADVKGDIIKKGEEVPYYLKEVKEYYEADTPKQVSQKIVQTIQFKKPIYKNKETLTPKEIAEAASLSKTDKAAILEFEDNLNKNKNLLLPSSDS